MTKPNIFFTSDLHIGHENINKYCYRPYPTSTEMDAYMLDRWNEVVTDDDIVYVLGDIHHGRGSFDKAVRFLELARGQKNLILGNHDDPGLVDTELFYVVSDYSVLRRNRDVKAPWDIILFHYPIESWDGRHKGTVHLHGHSHGKASKIPRRIDIGVDAWDYTPVSLDQIIEKVQSEPWKAEWK